MRILQQISKTMKTNTRTAAVISLAVALACVAGCRSGRSSGASADIGSDMERMEELYRLSIPEGASVDWDEEIPVFHFWKEILPENYLFSAPSEKLVAAWKAECERRNPSDSVSRYQVQGCYRDMNQYMTVRDFTELWYVDDSFAADDDLTLWRLEQFDSEICQPDSEYDRFQYLKNRIQSLCLFEAGSQWELNLQSGFEADFQEFYDRVLLREAIRHSGGRIASALLKEEEAWKTYHASLDSAFREIDGGPLGTVGSAWPMAICEIAWDDALTRAVSLEDFYFALTDSLDYEVAHRRSIIGQYDIERHAPLGERQVLAEYRRFMAFFENEEFFEPGFSYPVPELRRVLDEERKAWQAWMRSRDEVSSLLDGLCRDCYDNATNNVRRLKLIMLKNRYQGYGLSSGDIEECLVPRDVPDGDLSGPGFEENWARMLAEISVK